MLFTCTCSSFYWTQLTPWNVDTLSHAGFEKTVGVHVYIHVHVHVSAYACTCTCTVHVSAYTCTSTCTCTCTVSAYSYTCTCTYFVGSCRPTHLSHPMTSSTTSSSKYGPSKFGLLNNFQQMYMYTCTHTGTGTLHTYTYMYTHVYRSSTRASQRQNCQRRRSTRR